MSLLKNTSPEKIQNKMQFLIHIHANSVIIPDTIKINKYKQFKLTWIVMNKIFESPVKIKDCNNNKIEFNHKFNKATLNFKPERK